MKKAFLILGLAAGTFAASAHGNNDGFTNFKPKKGDVTTEAGLVGGILNSDFNLNNGAGMLHGRYFIKNDLALRLGLNLSFENERTNVYGLNNNEGHYTTSQSIVLVNLGIEKHFKGTSRLSPYVGGDILIGSAGNKLKSENSDATSYVANYNVTSKSSDFTIGLRGVVGADYYIAPKVYLGGEVGLGFSKTWDGKSTLETNINGTTNKTTLDSQGSAFVFAPSIVTGVRIGFVF